MKKSTVILLLGLLTVLILASAYAILTIQNDGLMIFPRKPHGQFIQAPIMSKDGETSVISWILPVNCTYNSYEVQEVGYKSDSKKLWGGIENASCTRINNGYSCKAEVHPEMKGDNKEWQIQATAYECADGNYYISKAVISE